MRYFILSAHGGIAYLAALRILDQADTVCTFLVPYAEADVWSSDPRLARFRATKSALIVHGDVKNTNDVGRAWHVAEMGIDSECSGVEAVVVSDVSTHDADELLAVLKCFPGYPYPHPPFEREPSRNSVQFTSGSTRIDSVRPKPARPVSGHGYFQPKQYPSHLQAKPSYRSRTTSFQIPLSIPRSPSYSSRSPRLVLVSPPRSLVHLNLGIQLNKIGMGKGKVTRAEHLVAWAIGSGSESVASSTVASPATEPGTPVLADTHSVHSSDSSHHHHHQNNKQGLTLVTSLFPDSKSTSGGWLDPSDTLVVRPGVLLRRRCRGDTAINTHKSKPGPYKIQEHEQAGSGWTISKKDVAHFIVERALGEWGVWGGRRVRIAY